VVENDRWIRLVMCDLLVQAGYRVAEASNGFSALRLAQRELLALVLLDLVLPEQSGLSVLAELRAAHATAHVPVIVFSPQPRCGETRGRKQMP
jgi:DNA-binding response OmpR family regulator